MTLLIRCDRREVGFGFFIEPLGSIRIRGFHSDETWFRLFGGGARAEEVLPSLFGLTSECLSLEWVQTLVS